MIPSPLVTEPRPRLVTRPFVLVGLASLAYFTADGVLIPTVPLYVERALRGGDVAAGVAVGAFSLTALVLRPLSGRLGDRRGRRLLLLMGAGLFGLSVLGYSLADSTWLLTVFRLITGAGEAFFFVGAAAAIADLSPPERRGEALSFFSLSLYAGIGLGPVIGEAAIRGRDFGLVWVLGAALAGLAVLLSWPVPETRPPADRAVGKQPLVHPMGLLPGSALFASVVGMAGYFAFLPLYADEVGLSSSRQVFVLFSVVVLLVRSVGARIPDRVGVRQTSRGALLLDAAGLAIVALWRDPAGVYVGTVVFALGVSLAFPALMAMAVGSVPPAHRGAVVGTVTAFVDLAFAGPILLGVVADAFGYPGSFLASALVALAGFALLFTRRAVSRTARAA
jgi:MFS family permease